jgi:hypothetical protein
MACREIPKPPRTDIFPAWFDLEWEGALEQVITPVGTGSQSPPELGRLALQTPISQAVDGLKKSRSGNRLP